MLTSLREFTGLFAQCPLDGRQRFVESWCNTFLDGNRAPSIPVRNGTWMRLPLFKEVFAEVLEAGRIEGRPGYARWSAQLHQQFGDLLRYRTRYYIGPDMLLREALKLDPADFRARLLLAMLTIRDLNHACHELPSGLLLDLELIREYACEAADLLANTVWFRRFAAFLPLLLAVADGDKHPSLATLQDLGGLALEIERSLFPKSLARAFFE